MNPHVYRLSTIGFRKLHTVGLTLEQIDLPLHKTLSGGLSRVSSAHVKETPNPTMGACTEGNNDSIARGCLVRSKLFVVHLTNVNTSFTLDGHSFVPKTRQFGERGTPTPGKYPSGTFQGCRDSYTPLELISIKCCTQRDNAARVVNRSALHSQRRPFASVTSAILILFF